jgi:hypothetical protein
MKLGRVRTGVRFVYDHIGGVHLKVSRDKTRCIYGSSFGKELPVDPDLSVYALYYDRATERLPKNPEVEKDPRVDQVPPETVLAVLETIEKAPECSETPEQEIRQGDATSEVTESATEIVEPVVSMPVPTIMPLPIVDNGMAIIIMDIDEKVLTKIDHATSSQVVAYSTSEALKMNKDERPRMIEDSFVDHEKQTLYVQVGDEM